MRLIDADALVRDHGFFIEDEDGFPTCVVCETDIRYYPTIDAVPVVRCKDCKHWRLYEEDVDAGRCVKHNDHVARWDCDFCSYGERRSDD